MTDSQGDDGFSLVELLVAVAIVAIGFAGILGAMGGGILASALQRDITSGHVYAREVAEAIDREGFDPCATSYVVPAGVSAPPAGIVAVSQATVVSWWQPGSSTFGSTCPGATVDVLQLLEVTVTPLDSRSKPTVLQFTKRKP